MIAQNDSKASLSMARTSVEQAKISTGLAKTSTEIAKTTKKDSFAMRTLAVMSVFFLPATFVAVSDRDCAGVVLILTYRFSRSSR